MGNELMTATISNVGAVLSRITLAAMEAPVRVPYLHGLSACCMHSRVTLVAMLTLTLTLGFRVVQSRLRRRGQAPLGLQSGLSERLQPTLPLWPQVEPQVGQQGHVLPRESRTGVQLEPLLSRGVCHQERLLLCAAGRVSVLHLGHKG